MRTGTPADLVVEHTADCVVITMPAEIDLDNEAGIRNRLLRLLNTAIPALVLDLSGTVFCDSCGVNAILRAHIRAQAAGIPLWVVVPEHGPVRNVCDITGVTKIVEVAPSVTAARLCLAMSRRRR